MTERLKPHIVRLSEAGSSDCEEECDCAENASYCRHGYRERAPSVTMDRMRNVSQKFTDIGPYDENQQRGNWSNPIEFLLSCLGYVVGLGNIWRFPYLVYRNGGGAFFVPYFLMLFLCGMPLVLMEMALGQYWAEGALTVWKIAPLFKVYYCMITGWALFYLLQSLTSHLPWACCEPEWATEHCVSFVQDQPQCNGTDFDMLPWSNKSTFAADDYYHYSVLGLSDGLHDIGGIQWTMLVSLLFAWFLVFCVLIKGVKSLGKFSYVTSTLPYLVLCILLVKAVMQPGAIEGLRVYVTPDWSTLSKAQVWNDASTQIFYSSGVCFGCSLTMASFNTRRHPVVRDAIILAFGNSFTSIFSGSVVFSILGFMAHSQNSTIAEVVTSGPGLTFIAYPQAVTLLSPSPVWSTLFFVMLSLLALSSMFPMVENVISGIIDQWRKQLSDFKFWVTLSVCFVSFILGICLTTEGGIYVLQLFDNFAVGKALLFVGISEILVVGWLYGSDTLVANIEAMTGPKRGLGFFKILWTFVTPTLLIVSIVFSLTQDEPASYGDYQFPAWGQALGWLMTLVTIAPIPVYAIYKLASVKLMHRQETLWACVRLLCKPLDEKTLKSSKAFFDQDPFDD